LGAPEMVSMPMVHSAQTVLLSCSEINAISKRTEMSFYLTHVTLEYHRVRQNDFQAYGPFGANCAPMLRRDLHYVQTDRNKLHWTYITEEYDLVSPKPFPCPWYIWHKPCIYLAPRLKLSPNGTKWASNWFTSPRSTIKCVQNDIWAFGTFGANRASILLQD
jgi:hypothetical protein